MYKNSSFLIAVDIIEVAVRYVHEIQLHAYNQIQQISINAMYYNILEDSTVGLMSR